MALRSPSSFDTSYAESDFARGAQIKTDSSTSIVDNQDLLFTAGRLVYANINVGYTFDVPGATFYEYVRVQSINLASASVAGTNYEGFFRLSDDITFGGTITIDITDDSANNVSKVFTGITSTAAWYSTGSLAALTDLDTAGNITELQLRGNRGGGGGAVLISGFAIVWS